MTELMDSKNGKGRVIEGIRAPKEQAVGALSEGGRSLAVVADLAESFRK